MDDTLEEASEIEELRQIEININAQHRIITRLSYQHGLSGFRHTSWSFQFPTGNEGKKQRERDREREILLRKCLEPNGYAVFINPSF